MRIQSAVVRNGTTNSSWTFTLKCVLLNFPSFKLSAKYIFIPSYIPGQSQGCPPFLCNLVIGIHTTEHLRNFEQLIFSWQALLDMLVQCWSTRLWGYGILVRGQPHPNQHPKIGVFPVDRYRNMKSIPEIIHVHMTTCLIRQSCTKGQYILCISNKYISLLSSRLIEVCNPQNLLLWRFFCTHPSKQWFSM